MSGHLSGGQYRDGVQHGEEWTVLDPAKEKLLQRNRALVGVLAPSMPVFMWPHGGR